MSHLAKIITFTLLTTTSYAAAAPMAVYNQAYQENYQNDKIADIITEAKNAYVLIDPFQPNVQKHVADIHLNNNQVGAYISIGTAEDWRDDFAQLKPFLVTKEWGEWPGEYFVSQTNTGILDILHNRLDQIADWGFDWVEFDNMDWIYDEDLRAEYGVKSNEQQGIEYAQALCDYVHQKGMKCMAKNVAENSDNFDGVLYESYEQEKNWWEVDAAQTFLKTGKLFIVNHYDSATCDAVYDEYKTTYSDQISFICEDSKLKKYVHYNQ